MHCFSLIKGFVAWPSSACTKHSLVINQSVTFECDPLAGHTTITINNNGILFSYLIKWDILTNLKALNNLPL